jgi:hypothetical protein|tara:strand:- start:2545 stop:2766 length:222 start_codon:yes stop_codon:yes gene_type:complete
MDAIAQNHSNQAKNLFGLPVKDSPKQKNKKIRNPNPNPITFFSYNDSQTALHSILFPLVIVRHNAEQPAGRIP